MGWNMMNTMMRCMRKKEIRGSTKMIYFSKMTGYHFHLKKSLSKHYLSNYDLKIMAPNSSLAAYNIQIRLVCAIRIVNSTRKRVWKEQV